MSSLIILIINNRPVGIFQNNYSNNNTIKMLTKRSYLLLVFTDYFKKYWEFSFFTFDYLAFNVPTIITRFNFLPETIVKGEDPGLLFYFKSCTNYTNTIKLMIYEL